MMVRYCCATLVALASTLSAAQPKGLSLTGLPFDAEDPVAVERVFPRIAFDEAVHAVPHPDGDRILVTERRGLVHSFSSQDLDPSPDSVRPFLDLRDRVFTENWEQGLLSISFSPLEDELFAFYVALDASVVIARYPLSGDGGMALADQEAIVLRVPQPSWIHNGGTVTFGLDGMLYAAFGDGGIWGDPRQDAQNLSNLLGAMIRIDVLGAPDAGLAYAIPGDNPLLSVEGARPEIFAHGFRNPFRFSVDRLTGEVLLGDVGHLLFEEINRITPGGNYGWPIREGPSCFQTPSGCQSEGLTPPIHSYTRDEGASALGGFIYRGDAFPALAGSYLYADFVSGRLGALTLTESGAIPRTLSSTVGFAISTVMEGSDGEPLLLEFGYPGGLHRLVENPAGAGQFRLAEQRAGLLASGMAEDINADGLIDVADYVALHRLEQESSNFPLALSESPLLLEIAKGEEPTSAGIHSYRPSAELWSDGAEKSRFLSLPEGTALTFVEDGSFDFPTDSVLVKNFSMPSDWGDPKSPRQRIETRLYIKREQRWVGLTYQWNDEGTDAHLVGPSGSYKQLQFTDDTGSARTLNWRIPSRSECAQCHTAAAKVTLGFTQSQLNYPVRFPTGERRNQLREFISIGLFHNPPPEPLPAPTLAPLDEESEPLHSRALGYLAANCAHCHRPGGPTPVGLDLRAGVNLGVMSIVGLTPSAGTFSLPNAAILQPGMPSSSLLLHRMETENPLQRMPPLGSSLEHRAATKLIREWIEGLGEPASDPFVVAANLHPQQWEPFGETSPILPQGDTRFDRGLIAQRPHWEIDVLAGWRPQQGLAPLGHGRWKVTAALEPEKIRDNEYLPEVRLRVSGQDPGGQWHDVSTSTFRDGTGLVIPKHLELTFAGDADTTWSVALEVLGHTFARTGGYRFTDLTIESVPTTATLALQEPQWIEPRAYADGFPTQGGTLRWYVPFNTEPVQYEIYRELNTNEFPREQFVGGEFRTRLLAVTTVPEVVLPEVLAPGTNYRFRVVAQRGSERRESATRTVRTAPLRR
jgi:uncharacterized repeat protein (TIGR03806 family)